MIRRFSLRNEYGEEYPLYVPERGYFDSPEGLGFSIDASYTKLGSSWVRNSYKDAQGEITGNINFMGRSPYTEASAFEAFVRSSDNLTLIYVNPVGTYQRDVDLISYGKTEINENNILSCPVTLTVRSMWYATTDTRFTIGVTGTLLRYSYKWGSRFGVESASGTVILNNPGSVEASLEIIFNGSIVNPVLVLLVDGVETARCEITGEVPEGGSIRYSSTDGNLYCYSVSPSGATTSLLSGLSIENANFFKLPVGTSVLQITADAQITAPVIITMKSFYKAV